MTATSPRTPYRSARSFRTRRATWAESSSDSTAMRPEITCSPPAKRRMVASSAARTVVFPTSTLASSSFTSAVSATGLVLSPCPPVSHPSARRRSGSLPAEVAVLDADADAGQRAEPLRELLDHRDGAVPAARAADSDRGVPLVLAAVAGEHREQSGGVAVEELHGALLAQHVRGDVGVQPGAGAQLRDPVRVRQEPGVGDDVGVGREAVLVAEAREGHPHARFVRLAEQVAGHRGELVDVELRRVDDDVGLLSDGGGALALLGDAVEDGAVALQRVRAPHLLEPAD